MALASSRRTTSVRKANGKAAEAIIGFGLAPAALLLWDVTSQPWACEPANHTVVSPIVHGGSYTSPNYFSCVNTFAGPLTTYHVMAAIFGAIALVGVIWGLVMLWRGGRHAGGGPRLGAA